MTTSSNGTIVPRYWPFVLGIHRSSVNSPHKGQWRGPLMIFFICARINGSVNNRETGDRRRHPDHYDVTIMLFLVNNWLKMATNKTMIWSLMITRSPLLELPVGNSPLTSRFTTQILSIQILEVSPSLALVKFEQIIKCHKTAWRLYDIASMRRLPCTALISVSCKIVPTAVLVGNI